VNKLLANCGERNSDISHGGTEDTEYRVID
jgi:hypothetical protein